MTVSYSQKISTTSFCLFSKLLMRWRGSVFKLIWKDMVLFLVLYASCSAMYRCGLSDQQKRTFEKVSLACEYFRSSAPISFLMGFYVCIVVARWWEQYMLIPWPDDICIMAAALIQGQDARSRDLRRCFIRYINLAFVLTFARISPRVSRSFPSYTHLIKTEYLTPKEKTIMEMVDKLTHHHQVWDPLPLVWASLVVIKARKEGYVPDDHSQEALIQEVVNLRYSCSKLQEYHNMSIPLVYTQVATMATYSYFMCSVVGRQYLDPEQGYKEHRIDLYVPIFAILQFIFYMGWLKVAESLLNPFGDDDDDFDTSDLLERHCEISYLIVDDLHQMEPHLLQNLLGKEGAQNQETQSNSNLQHNETSYTLPTLTGDNLRTQSLNKGPSSFTASTSIIEINTHNPSFTQSSKECDPSFTKSIKEYKPSFTQSSKECDSSFTQSSKECDSSFTQSSKECDPSFAKSNKEYNPSFTQSSKESFSSVVTTIPNTIKLQRSRSLSSSNCSSSDCSYDSCFSLFKQTTHNSKSDIFLSTTHSKRKMDYKKDSSFENYMHQMEPHFLQDLLGKEGAQNQETQSNSNHQHNETIYTLPTLTGDILRPQSLNKGPSSFNASISTVEINTHDSSFTQSSKECDPLFIKSIKECDPPFAKSSKEYDPSSTQNSKESFSSVVTTIPNTIKHHRSRSLSSSDRSSSDCSYDSCFSLFKQTTHNSKSDIFLSTTHGKRKMDYKKDYAFGKVQFHTTL